MKVIDLLNKIANGEEVPKKIKVYDDIYVLDEGNKVYEKEINGCLLLHIYNGNILNYEVEIIEEDKKIEKVDLILDEQFSNDELQAYIKETQEKVNEIIDYLEENK